SNFSIFKKEEGMVKRVLVLVACFLLMGVNAFAGNGDLIVNGNVGIGTTIPSSRLHIVSPSGSLAGIGLDASANNAGIVMNVSGVYRGALFATSGVNDGLVLKTGNDAGSY
ncbi:MAG: hypothetical protein AB1442_10320, partial [Nitrospirota bacterium]